MLLLLLLVVIVSGDYMDISPFTIYGSCDREAAQWVSPTTSLGDIPIKYEYKLIWNKTIVSLSACTEETLLDCGTLIWIVSE